MPLGITSTPLHTSSVAAGSTTATKFENQSSVAAKKPLETKVKQGDQGSMHSLLEWSTCNLCHTKVKYWAFPFIPRNR